MDSTFFPANRRSRSRLVAAVLSLFGIAALAASMAPAASANPIGSGSTSVKLRPAIAKVLKANGVSVAPIKPAKVKGGAIVFPVTGGNLDPVSAVGQIRHSGGLRFKAGKRALVTRSFTIRTKAGVLQGKVGGATVNLFKVEPQAGQDHPSRPRGQRSRSRSFPDRYRREGAEPDLQGPALQARPRDRHRSRQGGALRRCGWRPAAARI